jgi:tetratricopeptide (TPR) repeat protein
MKRTLFTLLLATIASVSLAQQSKINTDELYTYNQAVDLYQENQYVAAQRLFEKVLKQISDETVKGNAAYYHANCAVRLNQRNADELVTAFVDNYPTSTKRNSAFIDVANYYFDNGDYRKAVTWYEKVDEGTLSRKQKAQYNFNKGYTLLQSKQYAGAKPYLNRVSDDEEYGSKAKYYLGYIAYEANELQEAKEIFDQVGESPEADEKLTYYQADLNYKLGNFDKAITLAQAQLTKSNRKEQSELNRIIGQSLFNQNKFGEALPYLLEYDGISGKLNNNDYYQLGYAYYKQADYEKAIETFNKIVDGENQTAQNAYYHLGQSYIKRNRSADALNAFKKACEQDYDATIKEDATYNYAKLSYENGNPYNSVPAVILDFLEKYPNSDKQAEMNAFLIDSYFTSKNYAEALKLLEKGRIKDNEAVYAKVSLYHGLNLFNANDYKEAIKNLNNTLKYTTDSAINKQAHFWKAESAYQLNDFNTALTHFKQAKAAQVAIEEDAVLDYNLGYTHFKLKDYAAAITAFMDYETHLVAKKDKARLNDAYLRIADANFVSKKYWPGMDYYNKAINMDSPNGDYALFQKAISYGFVQKTDNKIQDLSKLVTTFKNSPYRDDALFELGNTYISNGNIAEGINAYDQLIREFPSSVYTSQAMMRKGLQFYNDSKLDAALAVFKEVVKKYPGSPQASQAIGSARQIYIDQGKTNDYATWVRGIEGIDITDAELDDTAYESAEQPFIRGEMTAAAREIKKYLAQFPNGKHSLQANFYLAQALFADDEKTESIPHFEFVANKERSEFTEQALARLSEIHLAASDFAIAIPVLTKLEILADYPQNIIYAQSNLMKAYYEIDNYAQAVVYAEKVLADDTATNNARSDASVIKARSSWKQGDEAGAKVAYEKVRITATGSLAAEAFYHKAYFENKENAHDAAIATVQKNTKDYGSFKLWSAKGLVVMGKSYYAKKETLNATTILQYVVDNFAQYPDVQTEAQSELNKIKTTEAMTNSSVAPTQN